MNFGSKVGKVEVLILLLVRQSKVRHVGNINNSLALPLFYFSVPLHLLRVSFLFKDGFLGREDILRSWIFKSSHMRVLLGRSSTQRPMGWTKWDK